MFEQIMPITFRWITMSSTNLVDCIQCPSLDERLRVFLNVTSKDRKIIHQHDKNREALAFSAYERNILTELCEQKQKCRSF